MYSGEGACVLVEENVSGGEMNGFACKNENALRRVVEKISVRLRVLRMNVCMVL